MKTYDCDPDAEARRIARVTIAAECAALERGVMEGCITAAELAARRDRLVPALNLLEKLTK
jgi:hypothetical protein